MQRDRRAPDTAALRRRLLAGAAAVALIMSASVVHAQTAPAAPTPTPTPNVAGPDGLTPDALYLEADAASREGDVITASGVDDNRVLARFRGSTLRAGEISYDLALGVATANRRVEFTDAGGTVIYASYLELDSDMKAGVAVDLASRFANGSSLMAATAVRRSENVNELNYAIFTPCPICDAEGRPKQPSISIQAEKVVQNEELRAVLYRNAVFRLGGVPVLYLPYFAHPDPTVERASGFLVPIPSYDDGRGLSLETPYLRVISPSEDWLISPQFNTDVAPFLNLQWRRRFSNATVVARAGYTYEENFGDFDADGDNVPDIPIEAEHRSYLLAHGRWDPEGPWRAGFTAERTSDKTLFDRYDIHDPYQDNGLYYGDRRRLISQVYAERQSQRSYFSIAAFDLQSLRVAVPNDDAPGLNQFEADDSLPFVAPLIEARWEPDGPVLGGRLRLRSTAVSLYRDAYVGSPVLRPEVIPPGLAFPPPGSVVGLPGVDSRRVSGQAEWRRTMISRAGVRWEPFVDLRADAYSIADLPPGPGLEEETIARGRATAGLDISYPLIRRMSDTADLILEPMAQFSASTDPDLDPRIPNEDSQTLELDQSSLFRTDRFPGYDLLEGGLRFTAGMRATMRWDQGREASLFIGRSLRDAEEPGFRVPVPDAPTQLYDPSGLVSDTSDWVVQGSFAPSDRIRGWGHATIDSSGEVRRAEASVDGRWGRRNLATVTYIIDRSNPVEGPLNRNYEFVQLSGQQFIYGNWGVTVAGIADLEQDEITRSDIGLLFDDDCFRFELGWRRDNTRVRPTGPSEGIYVRLNLATFGGTGY
ncbi:LPS-assembly protein LptD [Brevundimonas sp.]|uniref:LPS-assembly protein LptD n=1 Tax=Brevundimonas sp. TaxID=1871086 RepID=UPI002FC6B877